MAVYYCVARYLNRNSNPVECHGNVRRVGALAVVPIVEMVQQILTTGNPNVVSILAP